jgi:hypothetical protein
VPKVSDSIDGLKVIGRALSVGALSPNNVSNGTYSDFTHNDYYHHPNEPESCSLLYKTTTRDDVDDDDKASWQVDCLSFSLGVCVHYPIVLV